MKCAQILIPCFSIVTTWFMYYTVLPIVLLSHCMPPCDMKLCQVKLYSSLCWSSQLTRASHIVNKWCLGFISLSGMWRMCPFILHPPLLIQNNIVPISILCPVSSSDCCISRFAWCVGTSHQGNKIRSESALRASRAARASKPTHLLPGLHFALRLISEHVHAVCWGGWNPHWVNRNAVEDGQGEVRNSRTGWYSNMLV